METLARTLQILGLLPLAAYPAVLIANAMQAAALLDASQRKTGSRLQRALMGFFVGATTLYPLVVFVCYLLTNRAKSRRDEIGELAWSAAPLTLLVALAALFILLVIRENREKK